MESTAASTPTASTQIDLTVKVTSTSAVVNLSQSQLSFSTLKLRENFSNYSAWHLRFQCLDRLLSESDDSTSVIASTDLDPVSLLDSGVGLCR